MNQEMFDVPAEWSEIVTITPDKARQWLRDFQYEGQRNISKPHVNLLAFEMQKNRFHTSEMRLVHFGGKTFQTDGQHRLHASVQTGCSIRVNVYHCSVAFLSDISSDYGGVDRGKIRTQADILAASGVGPKLEITTPEVNQLAAAAGVLLTHFRPYTRIPQYRSIGEREEAITNWCPEYQMHKAIGSGATKDISRQFRRAAVLAPALVMLRYQEEKAIEFWSGIVKGGFSRNDPRGAMERFLLGVPRGYNTTYNPTLARHVAFAWNRFYANRTFSSWKPQKPQQEIVILGTPYTGERQE